MKKSFCLSVLLIIFLLCGCSNSSIKSEPVSSALTNEQAIATAKSLNEKYNLSMDKVFNLKYSTAEVETDGYNRYIVLLAYEYENKNRQLNKNDLLFYFRYDPDTENILSSRICFWATDNYGISDQDGWEYLKSKDEFGWGTDPNASTENIDPESTPDSSADSKSQPAKDNSSDSVPTTDTSIPTEGDIFNFNENFDSVCSSELRDLVHIKDLTYVDDKVTVTFTAYDETTSRDCGELTRYAIQSITDVINYDESISSNIVIEVIFNKDYKHKFVSNYEKSTSGDYLNMGYTLDGIIYPDGYFSIYKVLASSWIECPEMLDGYLGN